METFQQSDCKSGTEIALAKCLPLPCRHSGPKSGRGYPDDAWGCNRAHTFALSIRRPVGRLGALAALGIGLLAAPLQAQWRVEGWLGDALNAPTTVTFRQANEPPITAQALWSTRPFAPTWVYAVRFAHWKGAAAWAFEYMHHKIYLDNPPPCVAYFRVTNGVNFFLAERLWRRQGWEFGVGATPIFAVPVSEVRGLVYDNAHGIFHSQYELSGFGLQANLARRVRLVPFTYGTLALKATAAHLYLHIGDGHAVTDNFALHIQYGLSLQSKAR
jgi:hypothetical protein